jgi:CDP-6-deoxy-D-xylo-4-hexulose-3-dehydrase
MNIPKYRVPYGGALIGKEEVSAINRIVATNYWPAAKEADLMEKEAAKQLGVTDGILANSGSSACLLALTALELAPKSEVIIGAVTFPTVFNAILQCGLTPVVVDSKIGTYNLEPDELEKAITKNTKAIIAVHAVGNPCDMPAIMKIAKKYGIKVIEDNCDGWGGTINGKAVGAFGDISFTSFHAAHIVAMGQGGGVFTNNKEIARKVRMYRDWGRQSDIPRRTNNGKWKNLPADYDMRFIYEKVGYNLGPLELQAAMGRVQLKRTAKIKALRKANFHYLFKHLSKFDELIMPTWVEGADPSWFSFPLSTIGKRGPLVKHLEARGIETRSMFAGNILKHPAYENMKIKSYAEQANWILEHSFWIGVHPRMTQADREYVVKAFEDYYAGLK